VLAAGVDREHWDISRGTLDAIPRANYAILPK
jgi:hypothetical protein